MKIVVLNFSGNVGKSTIAKNLLRPRLNEAQIFEVESINTGSSSDDPSVIKLRGKKFGEIVESVMLLENAIIDVGASNVEDFLKQMQQYSGSHEEFDYFLIPTVKEKKQQTDTVNTIRALNVLGVPRKKIRVVFNKLEKDESADDEFSAIFGLAQLENSFTLVPNAIIFSNEVFEKLRGKTLDDINDDATDYRALLRQQTSMEDKEHCVKMVLLKQLSKSATANMNDVYRCLFK